MKDKKIISDRNAHILNKKHDIPLEHVVKINQYYINKRIPDAHKLSKDQLSIDDFIDKNENQKNNKKY